MHAGDNSHFQRQPKGHARTGVLRTGDFRTNITMQGDLQEAQTHTVQFNVTNNPASNNPIRTEAIITWFVGGNTVIRRVSVGDGTSVSGTGNSVHVQIVDRTVDAGFGAPNGVEYTVSVQVAKGVRAAIQQPPILVPIPGAFIIPPLGGLNEILVPVPDDTGIISVLVTAYAFGLTTIPNCSVSHNDGIVIQKIYNPTVYEDWIPLAPGATVIHLQNRYPGAPGDPSIFFSVTFGIDG